MPDSLLVSLTPAPDPTGAGVDASRPGKHKYSILTRWDKFVLTLMVGIPLLLVIIFIWGPTVASILFSFTDWQGYGPITAKNVVGIQNYVFLVTQYALFWPALIHNLMWLGFFVLIASPIGIFFAVLLDREMRGSRIYQNIFYFPVVLSLAVVGFIWELQYAPDGFIDSAFGLTKQSNAIDWLGNPSLNIWAVLVAASWRHVGYIMVLYLAGLKSVDPTLREASAIDGASERQTFFQVIFPLLRSVIVTIVVVQSIFVFNDFQNPLYFLPGSQNATVQLTLFNYISQSQSSFNLLFANILVITIPMLIMYIVFNRQIVAGLTSGAVKG